MKHLFLFAGFLFFFSCNHSYKNESVKLENKVDSLILELDRIYRNFEILSIDSAIYITEKIYQISSEKEVYSDFYFENEKELQIILKYFDYYLQQVSELKKELISGFDHLNDLKSKIRGTAEDSLLLKDLLLEEKMIVGMRSNYKNKFEDLLLYRDKYLQRFRRIEDKYILFLEGME